MSFPKHIFLPKNFYLAGLFTDNQKKFFIGFCVFWLLIAGLEFGQDYLSAILNGNSFMIGESLSYKFFWLLFVPLSIALDHGFTKTEMLSSKLQYFVSIAILVIVATLTHLIVFSFILFGISNLLHENPVTLLYLLYEKLSTRLYIALSIYAVLFVLYMLVKKRRRRQEVAPIAEPKMITVKNGKSTILVDAADIKWIGSDGGYLDIHTNGKKYVVLDSLKNIIKKLPGNFKRIHKSTIVNIDRIRKLKSRGNGDYDVIMDGEQVLRLSRNYAKNLKGLIL